MRFQYITRTGIKRRLRPACASGSLFGVFDAIVNAAWFNCYRSDLPSIRCENERLRLKGRSRVGAFSFSSLFFVIKGYFKV